MTRPEVELNEDEDMVVIALINDEALYEMCTERVYSLSVLAARIDEILLLWKKEIKALAGHDVDMDNISAETIAEWFWYEEQEND